MTARAVLAEVVREAQARFRYEPDAEGTGIEALLRDEWDTAAEFEARGGGDCDGFACWAVERAAARCPEPAGWMVIVGTVKLPEGRRAGHMWVGLDETGTRWWADPTAGIEPARPADGRFTGYVPEHWWSYEGDGHFDRQRDRADGAGAARRAHTPDTAGFDSQPRYQP